jgi:hypothetical protein
MDDSAPVEFKTEAHDHLPPSKVALTPPTSEDMDKKDGSSSELSDLELDDDDDDDWEIEPDHYWDGGKIPVFKPVRPLAQLPTSIPICFCTSYSANASSCLVFASNHSRRLWNSFGVSPSS